MLTTALLSKHLKKQQAKLAAEQAVTQPVKMVLHAQDERREVEQKKEQEKEQEEPVRLTAKEVALLRVRLRKTGSLISPWRLIAWQTLAGATFALLVWVVTGKAALAVSAAYGALAVVIPAALFARGLMSQFSSLNALTAGFGFFLWEMLKIAVTIVLIAVAPKLVADLDWLAMLIGLIVTMKAVWLVLWLGHKTRAAE